MDEKDKRLKPIDLESNQPSVVDEDPLMTNDDSFHEETSSELVDHEARDSHDHHEVEHDDAELKNIYGWISIALSVISFFVFPFILAIAGIIVGFIARTKDAPILGNTAIVIGALSIIVRLFILPLI